MAHERPEYLPLGTLVVEQRHHLSLSQTDAVRRIHNAAKAEGRQSGATKQWISEIERTGRVPHPDALRWLAAAIEVPVEQVVAAADEQRRLRRRNVPGGQPPRERAFESAARLMHASVDGRAPPGLTAGVFLPVRNGLSDGVSVDAEAMNAFRAADRQVGGGHLYGTVVHYLRTEVAPRLFGSTVDDGGLLAFCAAAGLTDMAGWMAHDADRNVLAQQHFQRALALASIGEDCQLRAHILAGMSHLAHHLGHPDEAMRLADAGTGKLREGPANPELAARLLALEARGHAARGEAAASARLLMQAEQALDAAQPVEGSTWISRFDEASLANEAARCLRQLGQLTQARRQAERIVALRSGNRPRSRAFAQLILAHVLIEERNLDEASVVGRDILDGTRALGSFLVVRQLQRLRDLLATTGQRQRSPSSWSTLIRNFAGAWCCTARSAPTIPASRPRGKGRSRGMASFQGDDAAWEAYLAEGNAKQARKRVAADVLVRDASQRILLVDPSYKPDWDLPGGMAEANEPPLEAARREVREELGFELAVGRLLCVDWVSPHGPWDDTLMFLFDGGTLTAAESASVRLLDKELLVSCV